MNDKRNSPEEINNLIVKKGLRLKIEDDIIIIEQ